MKNPTNHPIHQALGSRWSPYSFDPEREVSTGDLAGIFEAARWTMSSYNAQPWRYIVGVRNRTQAVWEQVFESLLEGNQAWARNAPVLALGLTEALFEHNGKPNMAYQHDLGAASASLTFEASTRGLVVHQMIGIDREKACDLFHLTGTIQPFTGLAIGYVGSADSVGEEYAKRDLNKRERKPMDEIIIHGGF
ncbi:MAG: nitroreductase family protein [Gammaproteobacteria bacterium]|nr:nitroreductase family protein [Gammaproteobacteria bacterium]NNK98394.1 nitroreductase family protein [Xanthomonadales bacterium]